MTRIEKVLDHLNDSVLLIAQILEYENPTRNQKQTLEKLMNKIVEENPSLEKISKSFGV